MNIEDFEVVKIVKNKSLSDLLSDPNLITYWANDSQEGLLSISDRLNINYRDSNKLRSMKRTISTILEKSIYEYEIIIDCISKLNAAFLNKYFDGSNADEKEHFYVLEAYTRIHINRLQHQCNQLIYWKQYREYKISFMTAVIVAVISFFLSLVSIGVTIHYSGTKNTSPMTDTALETLEKENDCRGQTRHHCEPTVGHQLE